MAKTDNPKLDAYRAKRNPGQTPEPFGRLHIPATDSLFVVQQHAARHLHFDLRLEHRGVLKSWAVPKGLSNDPADKRLAMATEDHPLDYADFEGEIPPGAYGAGHVIVWDRGHYEPLKDMEEGLAAGKLLFNLHGRKLHGRFTLVRLKTRDSSGQEWLCIKEQDGYADSENKFSNTSVLSGLTLQQRANPAPKARAVRRLAHKLSDAEAARARAPKPMLAKTSEAHNRRGWVWELKYDGYRVLACKDDQGVRLHTRNGHLITDRFPEICQVLTHLPVEHFVIDGEVVVHDTAGRPDFNLMQQRARSLSAHQISVAAITSPATYYCFDLIQCAGRDLTACTLLERKSLLRSLLPDKSALTYSEHVVEQGRKTFAAAEAMGIEGVVGKLAASPYRSGRSGEWVKARHQRTADLVVVGWSPAQRNPQDMGSLALAEYRGGVLTYAGHAGSGLGQALRARLLKKHKSLSRKTPTVGDLPAALKTTHWWRASLVVEVAFSEYTASGHLRHPSILRLRDDKPAAECISHFDDPSAAPTPAPAPRDPVTITNPDKVFFPAPDFRKADLVRYYRQVARWMLPYLADRPIVLTRFPDGVDGKSFYQRDAPDYVPNWLRRETLWSESTEREVDYFIVQNEEDLAYLANMGTLPIHMWHSRIAQIDRPDWCVLDLDPKDAPFDDVITLANAIGSLCDEVDLPAFVKTSGASGLHVLMPLDGQLDHNQARTLGELLARVIVQRHPEIATVERLVRARKGRVYVDFMQNGHGRLIVAPFAVRAEPAASVSMPLGWHEVKRGLHNHNFHIGNAVARLRRRDADPNHRLLREQADLARVLALLAEHL
ncbi:MAG: DNA ligase D [Pseudomonadota bacterium]